MDGVMEIITGRERRRRWSLHEKLRLVAETNEPGVQIRAVAARNDVCTSLLFTWRRQARAGLLGHGAEGPTFVPVRSIASPLTAGVPDREMSCTPQASQSMSTPGSDLIEIELGGGRRIRVGSNVSLPALRCVLAALGA
jgi:transposase